MKRLFNQITSLERKLRALKLRKAGATYQMIAEQLGHAGPSGAHKAVAAALKLTLREPADAVRKLELERLDAAQLAIWRRVQAGDYGAIDRLLGIIGARAKLTGTFAPQKLEHSGAIMAPEVDHEALREKLEAKLQQIADNLAKAPPEGQPEEQ